MGLKIKSINVLLKVVDILGKQLHKSKIYKIIIMDKKQIALKL